eukprot:1080263-Amphidinium_carterae.1
MRPKHVILQLLNKKLASPRRPPQRLGVRGEGYFFHLGPGRLRWARHESWTWCEQVTPPCAP